MAITIVQLGSPRKRGEGVRIGTVRRPPRGVPKTEFARRDYYDVWLPSLAPSAELVSRAKDARSNADWKKFVRQYRAQMNAPDATRLLDVLAALSRTANLSVRCYCGDDNRYHRPV